MKSEIEKPEKKRFLIYLAGIIPGLGQLLSRDTSRAFSIFLLFSSSLIIAIWYGHPVWFIIPGLIWLWNLWDVIRPTRVASISLLLILWLVMVYGIGWQVTEITLALFQNTERVNSITKPMLKPDFIEPKIERTDCICSDSTALHGWTGSR